MNGSAGSLHVYKTTTGILPPGAYAELVDLARRVDRYTPEPAALGFYDPHWSQPHPFDPGDFEVTRRAAAQGLLALEFVLEPGIDTAGSWLVRACDLDLRLAYTHHGPAIPLPPTLEGEPLEHYVLKKLKQYERFQHKRAAATTFDPLELQLFYEMVAGTTSPQPRGLVFRYRGRLGWGPGSSPTLALDLDALKPGPPPPHLRFVLAGDRLPATTFDDPVDAHDAARRVLQDTRPRTLRLVVQDARGIPATLPDGAPAIFTLYEAPSP